jgi:hypothetical protein
MSASLNLRSPLASFAIGVVLTLVLATGVVMALRQTGDPKAVSRNAPLIAAVIALGGVGTAQMVSIALDDRRARETRDIEAKRTEEARDIEARRARAAALQAYLERVGKLLTEKGLLNAKEKDDQSTPVVILARAHTLAVLEDLGPTHKRVVVQFLRESNLIPREVRDEKDKVVKEKVMDLSGANLRDADLFGLNLRDVGLDGAFLERANLREAHLPDADLGGTRMYGADLTGAHLSGGSLWNAQLQSRPDLRLEAANLSGANLNGADLRGADLREAHGLTQEQIDWTIGNNETRLSEGFSRPRWWSKGIEEQRKIVQERLREH